MFCADVSRVSDGRWTEAGASPATASTQAADADVAELHAGTVAEEADVAALVGQAGVIAAVGRAATGRDLIEVHVEDHGAVEGDADAAALGAHLLFVPRPRRPEVAALRGRSPPLQNPVRDAP